MPALSFAANDAMLDESDASTLNCGTIADLSLLEAEEDVEFGAEESLATSMHVVPKPASILTARS